MLKITPSRTNPFSSLRWAKIERPPKVTTISEGEVRPEYVGLKRDAIEAIWSSVVSYYRLRMQPPPCDLCSTYTRAAWYSAARARATPDSRPRACVPGLELEYSE